MSVCSIELVVVWGEGRRNGMGDGEDREEGRGEGDEYCIEKVTLTVIVVQRGEISLLMHN